MNNENNEMSPERMEKVLQFQEITGIESLEVAEAQLNQFNWQLETAIQDHLSANDPTESNQASMHSLEAEVMNGMEDSDSSSDEDIVPGPPPRQVVQAGFLRALFESVFTAALSPVRMAYDAIFSIFKFVHQLVFHRQAEVDGLTEVLQFISEYEKTYAVNHPTFFRGTYAQALNHAKTELKFLVIYLHSSKHKDTGEFCRSYLTDASVINALQGSIFWAVNVESREGAKVSRSMRESTYPYLSVIVLKNNKMNVVRKIEGLSSPAEISQNITEAIQMNERFIVSARAERQERAVTATLRQEQDAAYEASLRVDREKARKRNEEKRKKDEEENKRREEQQRIVDEKTRRRQMKVEWADRILPEPSDDCKDVIHIVVKLPKGSRLERKFRSTDSLSALFYFVFCHPESPDRLQITTNFPRRIIPCEPTADNPNPPTFQEFDLPNRSAVFVADLEA